MKKFLRLLCLLFTITSLSNGIIKAESNSEKLRDTAYRIYNPTEEIKRIHKPLRQFVLVNRNNKIDTIHVQNLTYEKRIFLKPTTTNIVKFDTVIKEIAQFDTVYNNVIRYKKIFKRSKVCVPNYIDSNMVIVDSIDTTCACNKSYKGNIDSLTLVINNGFKKTESTIISQIKEHLKTIESNNSCYFWALLILLIIAFIILIIILFKKQKEYPSDLIKDNNDKITKVYNLLTEKNSPSSIPVISQNWETNKHFQYFLKCKKDSNSKGGTNAFNWTFGVLFLTKPNVLDPDEIIQVNSTLKKILNNSHSEEDLDLGRYANDIWKSNPTWDKSKDWDKFLDHCKKDLNSPVHKYISPSLDKVFTRDELINYCNDKNTSDINALLAILAWGDVRDINGERIFQEKPKKPIILLDIVSKLRNEKFKTRSEAFESIMASRREDKLPGLGAVYITQLICFLAPKLNGFIMGQWTAKSINLITESKIVIIDSAGLVQDKNEAANYEHFCLALSFITFLYKTLGENVREDVTATDVEQYLFSQGGHKKGEWREYVIKNS